VLIPCIDLQSGQAVQLVHGRRCELAVADVFLQLERFRRYPWLHIIDLDAAMGKGDNNELVEALCKSARRDYKMKVRVGGGVRTSSRARRLIRCGATQIIIGSAVFRGIQPNVRFLRALNRVLPRKKIVIALDTYRGKITTQGWRKPVALRPQQVMASLEPFCAAFLCTDVDREGTLSGANLNYFTALRAATHHPIIAAGGIKTRREVSALARLNMDAAVGMALYKNVLG
jgi:phosphoribosylformimino-5-aminoimidazole carboxamide ribonucleotide (ProFAR) isomerase